MSEWQPISTAPKDGTAILLLCPYVESEMTMGFFERGEWRNVYNGNAFNHEEWEHLYWHSLPPIPL